jgi:prepilin-type N-terminal cleavage/methylation domain-containing protein
MNTYRRDRMPRSGFTLIELLVVIAIIALLAATIRPMLSSSASKTREFACESNLKQVAVGVSAYVTDNGGFPPTLSALDPILRDKSLLACTATGLPYWYNRPAANAKPDIVIAACVDPSTPIGRRPHRFRECTLELTARGAVKRAIHE